MTQIKTFLFKNDENEMTIDYKVNVFVKLHNVIDIKYGESWDGNYVKRTLIVVYDDSKNSTKVDK